MPIHAIMLILKRYKAIRDRQIHAKLNQLTDEKDIVWVNNTALLRWVRLGKSFGNKVEVLSGLSKDETFIVHADGRLYNGAPVTVKKWVESV